MMGGAVYPGLCWDRLRGYVEGMVIEFLMSFLILVGLIVTLPASALLDLIVTPNNVFSTHTHISCNLALFSEPSYLLLSGIDSACTPADDGAGLPDLVVTLLVYFGWEAM
jgi:hypothetical protein